MGALNYSNFEENETEFITTSQVEVVGSDQPEILPAANKGCEVLEGAINQSVPVVNVINSALGTISDIGKCISASYIARQGTEQVRARAYADIEESKQQTKRIKIQEREITNRLKIQCDENLKIEEMKLKRLREENRRYGDESQMSHEIYMKQLDLLNGSIQSVIKQKDLFLDSLDYKEYDELELRGILASMDRMNQNLVDLSDKVISLQKR